MPVKNFRLILVTRVLLLLGFLLLESWLVLYTELYLGMGLVALLIIYQFYGLIHYLELTNRQLVRFLDAIRYSDFSQSFRMKNQGASFKELGEAFNEVMHAFHRERDQKEEHFRYLQTVVEHIGIGLMAFNQEGNVKLLNNAGKRLLQVSTLNHISSLKKNYKNLYLAMKNIRVGEQPLIRVYRENDPMQLSLNATEFKLQENWYKLVSFQNIHYELEEKEMEAWNNLIQVLAHEIMNSITPISSLSDTVHNIIQQELQKDERDYSKEVLHDIRDALQTIHKRSQGLMHFVESYRKFSHLPEPEYEQIMVRQLLMRVHNLMKSEMEQHSITFTIETNPETLELSADPHLIEQVVINLLKNAIRAVAQLNNPQICLKATMNPEGRVRIQISDNGPGIPQSALDKIFVPFYTTRRPHHREGTGIGLSLSRQIMRMHNGSLTVRSVEAEDTTFTLLF